MARNGEEMAMHLRRLLHDKAAADQLARHGRQTILARHTCAHRVDELLEIYAELVAEPAPFVRLQPVRVLAAQGVR
jgi:spore maturation protein CgeB